MEEKSALENRLEEAESVNTLQENRIGVKPFNCLHLICPDRVIEPSK
jgi:hypothetical protein